MFSLSQIEKLARKNQAKIGIGDAGGELVKKSVERVQEEGYAEVEVFKDAESLVPALKNGKIDAAVRGTLGAKKVLDTLRSEFEVEKALRIAFLVLEGERVVLLAPVGVDEGQDFEEKLELINLGCELLAKFKVELKVGVLSGGRLEDFGRHLKVDETLAEGDRLTSAALDNGIQAKHFGILLEEAVKTSNMLVAPDGISGNLIFRALNFFGGAKGMGAPVVNIDKIFVDTSRAKEDYSSSIILASALFGL